MFRYSDHSLVHVGDKVTVSKKIAKEHAGGNQQGIVTSLNGFVTVQLANGDKIDLDMRSVKKSNT